MKQRRSLSMIVNKLGEDCGPPGTAPVKLLLGGCAIGILCILHALVLRNSLLSFEKDARELVFEQAMAFVTANVPSEVAKWYTYFPQETEALCKFYQDDDELVTHTRKRVLVPPGEREEPYNLDRPNTTDPSQGLAWTVSGLLGNMGFFVEAGALDGEVMSSTLPLERYLGWTGLLIEPDPLNFRDLYGRNRKSWLAPVCLSFIKRPILISFEQKMSLGKIQGAPHAHRPGLVDVQCLPFYTLMLAMNRTQIDYLSLDIEGSELDVLRTIPFGYLDITIISVEFTKILEGGQVLKDFMKGKGYRILDGSDKSAWGKDNYVFVREK